MKGSFYKCASFEELNERGEEYENTSDIIYESTFKSNMRGILASWTSSTSGDDLHVLNENCDLKKSADRVGEYKHWEELLTKCTL